MGDPADEDRLHGGPGGDPFNAKDGVGLDTICAGRGADDVFQKDPGDRVNPASCP